MGRLKNERHETFCQNYMIYLNQTKAYDITYKDSSKESSHANAARVMAYEGVVQRIEELRLELLEKVNITKEDVVASILDIRERCLQQEPVFIYDDIQKKKIPSGEWQFKEAGALRANDMLAKYLGMYNHEIKIDANIKTERLEEYIDRMKKEKDDETEN